MMINIKHLFWIVPLTSITSVITMCILFVGKESERLDNKEEGEV